MATPSFDPNLHSLWFLLRLRYLRLSVVTVQEDTEGEILDSIKIDSPVGTGNFQKHLILLFLDSSTSGRFCYTHIRQVYIKAT